MAPCRQRSRGPRFSGIRAARPLSLVAQTSRDVHAAVLAGLLEERLLPGGDRAYYPTASARRIFNL
jgi:hypothetical protein